MMVLMTKGYGYVFFQLQSGNIFHIDEIIYVPGLKKNLISVAVLESKGYSIAFTKGKALMWSSNEDEHCYDYWNS